MWKELPNETLDEVLYDTVKQNKQRYPKRLNQRAVRARKFQNIMTRPGSRQLADVAIHHLKSPISTSDVIAADNIFGQNLGELKGKTARTLPKHVFDHTDPVPRDILEKYRDVTLCVDIMFVNKIPFIITISRYIKSITIEVLPNRQVKTLSKILKNVTSMYERRGFLVASVLGDYEFEPLRSDFPQLNTTSADEHVPEAERCIRTIKERTRSTYTMLPFTYIPRLVLVHLVKNSVFWVNALPANDDVSNNYPPRYLLTGAELNYENHVQIEFDKYVQTHEEHDNSMQARTMGAICLGPSGNRQGGHWFMSLTSGSCVTRHR